MASALAGAPHIPGGDGAVRAPAFAEFQEVFGRGHVLLAVSDSPAFANAEVVDGKNIGAAEAENEKHFDGPGADAADRYEALDELLVGEFVGFLKGRHGAINGFLSEVFHGKDFCTGKAGFAEGTFA